VSALVLFGFKWPGGLFQASPPPRSQTHPTHPTAPRAFPPPGQNNNPNLPEQHSTPEGRPLLERVTALVNDAILPYTANSPPLLLSTDDVLALIDLGQSPGGKTGRHWVLDPIDGTRGFVGGRQYAVCLALLDQGELAVGVLGCPNLPHGRKADDRDGGPEAMLSPDAGALFACALGAGTWTADLWDAEAKLERVNVDEALAVAEARVMESYESRHSDHSFASRVCTAAGIRAPPLRLDSQAKYGLLSRGDAAVFMRFPPKTYREKIWDHAAGVLMVTEAGGVVSDAKGAPLDFSLGRWLDGMQGGIVAAPKHVHASVLKAIAEAGGEVGAGGVGVTDGGAAA
jgi:3'(2'), 5'-bisphosphate nucleotidase / inositol polyphosphate 1-phosphatase